MPIRKNNIPKTIDTSLRKPDARKRDLIDSTTNNTPKLKDIPTNFKLSMKRMMPL